MFKKCISLILVCVIVLLSTHTYSQNRINRLTPFQLELYEQFLHENGYPNLVTIAGSSEYVVYEANKVSVITTIFCRTHSNKGAKVILGSSSEYSNPPVTIEDGKVVIHVKKDSPTKILKVSYY